ncbi:MAG: glycosyltransferase family 4 protein [Pseudonocardiaceae bacterium]
MKILIVTHYFPPEIGAPQARLSSLARHWAAAGDEVTVLTGFPNHPTGVIPPEYRGKWIMEEHVDGYRVVRTWLYATPNERIVRKTLCHLSFMLSSVLLGARRIGKPDVVVVSSPTFFSIFSARVLARLRRARFVVEVRDLWPAIFVELGVLTNPIVIWALERLEMNAYRAADRVVVVTERFRENLIERGVPDHKVCTVRNGADLDQFDADPSEVAKVRETLGAAAGDTLVLYIGAHGISHGLEAVAEAASQLDGKPIRLAFVGEGAAKGAVAKRVRDLGVNNVTLHPAVPRSDVPAFLGAADICLVPLRDVPLFSTFIPSKMFEYFAAGKAVVGAVRGEPAEILADAGAVVVPPEDPTAMAEAIWKLADDPRKRERMARRAEQFVAEYFDRRRLAWQYRELLGGGIGMSDMAEASL